MARSRNIKPGFFINDDLAQIEPLGRLLFAGLWCIADREGRLEDRPLKIKAQVLPYDDCDVDMLLDKLAERKFIVRYEVDGSKYIQVTNFNKHQNPHKNEAPSNIPAPYSSYDNKAHNKHHTSTVQKQEMHNTNPADSLNLGTDSLNLGTDSLGRGYGGTSEDEELQEQEPNNCLPNTPPEETKNTTPEEREILSVLKSVEHYPFDFEKDLEFIRDLVTDYPGLDLLYQAKKWRDYKRDKPLTKKSSPRAQLRNWMNKANEWKGNEWKGENANGKAGKHTAGGPARADPAGKYREFVKTSNMF